MKINKSNLLLALAVVKPGLAAKELLEQTTSFAFIQGRVVTYNDEISISHPLTEVDFEGAVNAKELYGLLCRIEKDEIEAEIEDDELLLSCGRVRAGLKLESEVKLPLKSVPVPAKMYKISNPDRFRHLLSMALQTCSSDPSHPKLSCVALMENGVIIGADNYRLINCQADPLPVKGFLLPATSALEVVKINPTWIAIEKGWCHFKNDAGTVVSSRRVDDDYMPQDQIENVLKFDKVGQIEFPMKINDILDRVGLFAKGEEVLEEIIEINIEGGKMWLKARAETTGSWVEEKASIEFKGSASFLITPTLFTDILQVTRVSIIDKSLTKIKFMADDWEYVIMLRLRPKSKSKSNKNDTQTKETAGKSTNPGRTRVPERTNTAKKGKKA